MSEELKRERLELNDLSSVAGGVAVDVNSETRCVKPEGSFKILDYKEEEWLRDGAPSKCKYCWHLKFDNGFFCDV